MERDEAAISSGRSFMLTSAAGDIEIGTRQGLFTDDTRFLSCLRITLNGAPLVDLGGGQYDRSKARFYGTNPDLPDLPACSVVLEQRRWLNGHLANQFTLTNFGPKAVQVRLRVQLGADFADVLELRALPESALSPSDVAPPPRWHQAFTNRGGAGRCQTLVRWSRRGRHSADASEFDISLQSQESWRCHMRIEMTLPSFPVAGPIRQIHPEHEDGGPAVEAALPACESLLTPRAYRPSLHPPAPALPLALLRERARADIQTLIVELPSGERVIGAGLPYFMTLFGRDSIITAHQTLALDPRLAADTLRALAHFQGRAENALTEEQPGRIAHEVREGERAHRGAGRHLRYYGTVDATALFLVLFATYVERTGDAILRDELWPAAEAALGWLDRYGDLDGDGFIEYRRGSPEGLDNQGWKDSWDAISFRDGRLAEPPVALCEVQGYVFDAKLRMARLYEAGGDGVQAVRLREEARLLQQRFEAAFWMPDEGTYALALDGRKQQVDAVASNAAHCLWSGIASPEHAASVAERLSRPDCFSGWGLRSLSTGMARYNPIGYHTGSVWPHDTVIAAQGFLRYGHRAAAHGLVLALLEAAVLMPSHRLPELFAGWSRQAFSRPLLYPDANAPQAWAAGATLLAIELLQPSADAGAAGDDRQRGGSVDGRGSSASWRPSAPVLREPRLRPVEHLAARPGARHSSLPVRAGPRPRLPAGRIL